MANNRLSALSSCLIMGFALLKCGSVEARDAQDGIPDAPTTCPLDMRKSMIWGVAASAYQTEGAVSADGRTPSVWDTYIHSNGGNIQNGDTADVTCDMYHKYKEDFRRMRNMGVKHYRFSFSWNRILPQGGKGTPVNPKGIAFYNNYINEMIKNGIKPLGNMFHFDLPQVLQDAYGGPVSEKFIDDFVNYASVLFANFGDRVTEWMTYNEPWCTCVLQYGRGEFAPGIKLGDAGQYKCGHNMLLAHAKVYNLYHRVPQASLRGKTYAKVSGGNITMALNIEYLDPLTQAPEDVAAAKTGMEMNLGWFADPLYFGDYPDTLKKCAGSNLPTFTSDESALVKGSLDFVGINFYSAKYAKGYQGDPCAYGTEDHDVNGKEIGPQAESTWLRVVPWSLYKVLKYVDKRYDPKEIRVTENGVSDPGESNMQRQDAMHDKFRVDYFRGYIEDFCKAVSEIGHKITGYYAWSYMDNFEWKMGYTQRFGINYVDFKDPSRPRYAKDSSKYLSKHFFSVGKSGLQPKAVHKNKFLPRPKYSPPETSKLLLKAKPKSASKKDSERKPAHNSRFKAHP